MSAYITLLTPMTDEECLLAALVDVGIDRAHIEVHSTPVQLVDYDDKRRSQAAHIVIRRRHLGAAINDLGFLATPTGYQAVIDEYDRRRFDSAWMAQLHTRYQTHWAAKEARLTAEDRRRLEEERKRLVESQRQAVLDRARKLGYLVQETREGDSIRMVLLKRTY